MVHVMQNVQIVAEALAHYSEQPGHMIEILFRTPYVLGGKLRTCRLITLTLMPGHAVDSRNTGHPSLDAHSTIAKLDVSFDLFEACSDIMPSAVRIAHHPLATLATQQLIERHTCRLGFDVP